MKATRETNRTATKHTHSAATSINTSRKRIEPDGTVSKFPRIARVEREEIDATFRDMSARNPQLLSTWAMGRI